MFKFGMSDYEVSQNAPGVLIGNLLVYGAIVGAGVTAVIGLGIFAIVKAVS